MKEVIIKLNSDHIKVKGGEYVQDLVRCRECKYMHINEDGETRYCYCALEDRPNRQWSVDDTDYCSWGEVRDEMFENAIDKAPTIEPKRGKWIPCSERLPKENGRYLVTFPSLIDKPWTDILWYGRPTFPETDHPCFYASDDEYGDVEYDDVVAWMPLPEPYGEREGE